MKIFYHLLPIILFCLCSAFVTLQTAVKVADTTTGVAAFLEHPNNYTFKCGCDLGAVTNASLADNGDLTVDYFYPCNGKKLYGKLTGKYDRTTNQFKGIYNTENKMFYGQIEFGFNERGEANGTWGNGAGTIKMHLK